MVAEPWLIRFTTQMSSNLKSSSKTVTYNKDENRSKTKTKKTPETIGILSFEVANVLSKTVHLHKSLTNTEISKLKNEILKSEGIKTLVSSDETYLLHLAMSEKLEDLNFIAGVVSRLGKKCTVPQLIGFEHVYGDIVTGVIDVGELGFLVKDMDAMVRRMERYVNTTASLYSEMEVLNELEIATNKFQQNQHEESRKVFEQKVSWQKQDVRHLKDVSLWNQSFDKIVEMLARTVCTLYARICYVFADTIARGEMFSNSSVSVSRGNLHSCRSSVNDARSVKSGGGFSNSGFDRRLVPVAKVKPQVGLKKEEMRLFKAEDNNFACGLGPGRLFLECLNRGSSVSKFDDFEDGCSVQKRDDRSSQVSGSCSVSSSIRKDITNHSGFQSRIPLVGEQRRFKTNVNVMSSFKTDPRNRLLVQANQNTIGGSALALHYANVIIVIEKLLQYPHLVGEEARDDLYQMLPTSLRLALRTSLKSYVKDLAIYDAPLAHDWKDRLDVILSWLAPLAHNMIRWQNERNFEQHIVSRTNVLLLQTLFFADRTKTESAICELLVGLNYICRYEHQQNALLDCASSFDFEDQMEWQTQY